MPLQPNRQHGFTLVELVVSMAIYSIVLAMLGIIAVTFAGLYDKTLDETGLHEQTLKVQTFLTTFYTEHNGSIDIDPTHGADDPFFSYNSASETVSFHTNTLYWGDRSMATHPDFDDLVVTVSDSVLTVTILDISDNPLHTIAFFNTAGNTVIND
jgi:prepilin-type N-terminal cleavage/methylation domain-containing protein